MTDMIVLGFSSRDAAEEARRRSRELVKAGALDLNGAALAYRRDDGQIELVLPLHLAAVGAAAGTATGALTGLVILAPLLLAAVGAVAGAVGAELSAGVLNVMFVRGLKEVLEPGRAALFLVVREAVDPERTIEALRPLSPRVLRTNWTSAEEQRLIAAFAEDVKSDD